MKFRFPKNTIIKNLQLSESSDRMAVAFTDRNGLQRPKEFLLKRNGESDLTWASRLYENSGVMPIIEQRPANTREYTRGTRVEDVTDNIVYVTYTNQEWRGDTVKHRLLNKVRSIKHQVVVKEPMFEIEFTDRVARFDADAIGAQNMQWTLEQAKANQITWPLSWRDADNNMQSLTEAEFYAVVEHLPKWRTACYEYFWNKEAEAQAVTEENYKDFTCEDWPRRSPENVNPIG